MPYILRDDNGLIQAVSQSYMQGQGWEEVEKGSKEYLSYLDEALKKRR